MGIIIMPDKEEKQEKTKPMDAHFTAGLTWPMSTIFAVMGPPEPGPSKLEVEPVKGFADFNAHLGGVWTSWRSFALAYLCIYYIHGGEDGHQYPAYGRAQNFEWEWMWPLLVRNLIGTRA